LENDDSIATHDDEQLVARLYAQRLASIARDHNLILCGERRKRHRFTFYQKVKGRTLAHSLPAVMIGLTLACTGVFITLALIFWQPLPKPAGVPALTAAIEEG
jgi:hypothetical protein